MITVSATKSTHNRAIPKYSNDEPWNREGAMAPNGVSAYRWLRVTNPDPSKLSPLARWLVENLPACVAGRMPCMHYRVKLLSAETEADRMRRVARETCTCNGVTYLGSDARDRALASAEGLIRCYSLGDKPAQIDDWLFSQYTPETLSDDAYWNAEAERMLSTGAVLIKIRIGDKTEEFKI